MSYLSTKIIKTYYSHIICHIISQNKELMDNSWKFALNIK